MKTPPSHPDQKEKQTYFAVIDITDREPILIQGRPALYIDRIHADRARRVSSRPGNNEIITVTINPIEIVDVQKEQEVKIDGSA